MSFTAEVRDELARCEPECEYCDLSTLAALTRVSGTLSLAGLRAVSFDGRDRDGRRRAHDDHTDASHP